MVQRQDYEYALRISASACTCAQFLSGFFICTNFMKKGKVLNESVAPFVTGFLSCSLWLYYGMLLANSTLVSVNAFGCLLFATYTWIYYRYTTKKKHVVHYVLMAMAIIVWIVYVTNSNIQRLQQQQMQSVAELQQQHKLNMEGAASADSQQQPPSPATVIASNTVFATDDAIDRVGLVCCLTTMLFFAAPLSNLIHVIRVRNTESLPMPLIIMTFLVSAQWLIYGRMLRDKFIMYPNAVGCILSAVQLLLFVVYPRRSLPITVTTDHHHHAYNKLMDA